MQVKRNKLITLVACTTLLASLLSACGSSDNAGSTSGNASKNSEVSSSVDSDNPYKEPMEISIAFWDIDSEISKIDQDPIAQEILNKFNIKIKPVNTTWDDYAQKIQMWASSGQLPDIFAIDALGTQYQRKWVDQGVVKDLPDLAKYPSLAKFFETPDIAGLSVEGKHYTVPRRMFPSVDWSALDRSVLYRWDLAQKAGITKEPETWDEFKAMLDAIVKQDAEGKKVTGLTAGQVKMIGGLFWLYGNPLATSDGSGGDFKWVEEDGKLIPAVFSKKALPALQNMRDMYDNNLIDPDIALTKPDVAYDKFASGKAAAILIGGGYVNYNKDIYLKRWKEAYPDTEITDNVKVLKPLIGPDGERNHAIFKTYWSESYFSADVSDEKMDRIMALYDYVLSPEGKDLLTYGKLDVDYKVEGDKKVMIGTTSLDEKYPTRMFFKNLVSYETSDSYDMNNPSISNENIRKDAVEYIDWILENTKVPDYNIRLTYMSTPTKDKFSILDHDDLLKVMLSSEPVEQAWEKIMKDYRAKGLDKMIEEVNAKAAEEGMK
ncbi:extracellular solute-binding protein [Paenibacillus anaericanus]|uniref:Extracellular solute-binding protein n=1 Tax=Paenibacillus anaericanus TaxID=170367 RepID=A0A433XX40_9BACL|nr:extracellular solute-binding protein [Paenibacillus anaericanus]RUT39316.1 extracellular solute-binding protein [Paenibacillus anaericanus]